MEEVRLFLESAKADGDPFYAAYVLILVLALREGEVLGLPWDETDLDGGELWIVQQLQRVQQQLILREVKTDASEDSLPLIDLALSALRQHRKDQEVRKARAGAAWQNQANLVFTTALGTPIEPRNFLRAWTRRIRIAGVPQITVHDGRRTCATLLVELGVHPRLVMRILRHAQFRVSMEIYAQATSKRTREALRQLGESLN